MTQQIFMKDLTLVDIRGNKNIFDIWMLFKDQDISVKPNPQSANPQTPSPKKIQKLN